MGKNSFYLGDVGNASKMNCVLHMMAGVTMATLAEGLSLGKYSILISFKRQNDVLITSRYVTTASKAGLQQKDVLEVLELTNMASQLILEKGSGKSFEWTLRLIRLN